MLPGGAPGGGGTPKGSSKPKVSLVPKDDEGVGVIDDIRNEKDKDEEEVEQTIIDHPVFNGAIMIGICVNAIQMGMELQFSGGFWDIIWKALEHFFTAFFLIEFVIKVYILTPEGYISEKANCLDGVVVIVAVLDNWILSFFVDGDAMGSFNVISILRLVRLSRILKLLRAKRELMMLMEGIFSSIRSMFWLSILLSILVYTVSICFVKFIGRSDAYKDDDFDNKLYFGDMIKSCVTGFNLALLLDWHTILRPVLKRQPIFAIAIGGYVAVASFGIMNAIIGVIVSRTSAAAQAAEEEDRQAFRTRQMAFIDDIKDIIYAIDTDGDGTVSVEEMLEAAGNESLMDALGCVELPAGFNLMELHCMLDKDGDGELTKNEFGQGMRRLIFSNEFQRQCLLMLAVAQQKRKLYELRSWMEEKLEEMPDRLIKALEARGHVEPVEEPTVPTKAPIKPGTAKDPHHVPMKIDFRNSFVTIQTEDIPEFIVDDGTLRTPRGTLRNKAVSGHLTLPTDEAWPKAPIAAWENPHVNLVVNPHLRKEPLPAVKDAEEVDSAKSTPREDSTPPGNSPEAAKSALRQAASSPDATMQAPDLHSMAADAQQQPQQQHLHGQQHMQMSNGQAGLGSTQGSFTPAPNQQQQQPAINMDLGSQNVPGTLDHHGSPQSDHQMRTTNMSMMSSPMAGSARRVGPPPGRPSTAHVSLH